MGFPPEFPVNMAEAIKYYKIGAAMDNEFCIFFLGGIHEGTLESFGHVSVDMKKAYEYYRFILWNFFHFSLKKK